MNNHYITNQLVRVVLYLRLSDEDRDKLTKEQISKSVKNQELMLREYAENEGFKIVGDFIDKVLIGHYDEETNSRDIKVIWNFQI